jgi:hypothetical protein
MPFGLNTTLSARKNQQHFPAIKAIFTLSTYSQYDIYIYPNVKIYISDIYMRYIQYIS